MDVPANIRPVSVENSMTELYLLKSASRVCSGTSRKRSKVRERLGLLQYIESSEPVLFSPKRCSRTGHKHFFVRRHFPVVCVQLGPREYDSSELMKIIPT